MNLNDRTKKELLEIVDELEIEVEAKKKDKPTNDELIKAIEAYSLESDENLKELEEVYVELFEDVDEDTEVEEDTEVANINIFTYVGKGESSPQKIKFMGRQDFVRGRATEVTDPVLLAKVVNNPCFIQGEVDPETLQGIEDDGIEKAARNRKIDREMDEAFQKQHGGKE